MSGYTSKPSETSGYTAPQVKMVNCRKCSGSGTVDHVTFFDETAARTYNDAYGNPKTVTVKTGSRKYKSKIQCPDCLGKGQVAE